MARNQRGGRQQSPQTLAALRPQNRQPGNSSNRSGATMSRTTSAQQVVDSLAQLFESSFPDNRAEAEEELRDAGVDPQQVGRRLKRLAETALAEPGRTTPPTKHGL